MKFVVKNTQMRISSWLNEALVLFLNSILNVLNMKTIFYLLFLVIWTCNVSGQSLNPEIVSSAGETYQGSSMQIDWTLGELSIVTIQNASKQITQGFHQPIYTITSVNELPQELGEVNVYPNPTSGIIMIKINLDNTQNVRVQLIDFNGKLIWTKKENGSQIEWVESIKNLPNGTYFLNLMFNGNKHSQTFKILKND
jgi:hypothetical protein